MNTNKTTCLNSEQVETATLILRAYKHRYRYCIIEKLLSNGRMSSGEIASYLNMEESYISKHLAILRDSGLVMAEYDSGEIFFHANEEKLMRIKEVVTLFANS